MNPAVRCSELFAEPVRGDLIETVKFSVRAGSWLTLSPLACGGPDAVSNLQWQTIAAARAKDRGELKACGH